MTCLGRFRTQLFIMTKILRGPVNDAAEKCLRRLILMGFFVFSCQGNILLNRTTFQSGDHLAQGRSYKAVDGDYNANYGSPDGSCTHTTSMWEAWWAVDMGRQLTVTAVTITNRITFATRLSNFQVAVSDVTPRDQQPMTLEEWNSNLCTMRTGRIPGGTNETLVCDQTARGQYLVVQFVRRTDILTLCEVTVETLTLETCQMMRPDSSDVDLTALMDGDETSCKSVAIKDSMLLNSIFMRPIRGDFQVAVVSSTNIVFGPGVSLDMCTVNPSLLMTHLVPMTPHNCDIFCEVPRTCRYGGKEETGSYTTHSFHCSCKDDFCSEIMLMLRAESIGEILSICEIYIM